MGVFKKFFEGHPWRAVGATAFVIGVFAYGYADDAARDVAKPIARGSLNGVELAAGVAHDGAEDISDSEALGGDGSDTSSASSGGSGAFTIGGSATTSAAAASGGTPAGTVRSFTYTTLTGVTITCTGVAGTGEDDDTFKEEQGQLTGTGGWIPTGAAAARAAGVDTTPRSCRRS